MKNFLKTNHYYIFKNPNSNPIQGGLRVNNLLNLRSTSHWNDHCFTRSHLSLLCSALPFYWSRLGQEDLPQTMQTMRKNMTNHMCPVMGFNIHISYLHNSIIFMYGSQVDQQHPTTLWCLWCCLKGGLEGSKYLLRMYFLGCASQGSVSQNAILAWYLHRHALKFM